MMCAEYGFMSDLQLHPAPPDLAGHFLHPLIGHPPHHLHHQRFQPHIMPQVLRGEGKGGTMGFWREFSGPLNTGSIRIQFGAFVDSGLERDVRHLVSGVAVLRLFAGLGRDVRDVSKQSRACFGCRNLPGIRHFAHLPPVLQAVPFLPGLGGLPLMPSGHNSTDESGPSVDYSQALTVNVGNCNLGPTTVGQGHPASPFRAPHPTPTANGVPYFPKPRANLAQALSEELAPDAVDSPIASSIVSAAAQLSDPKAPGSGRRILSRPPFLDYDQAKLAATKQMASYPSGTRYPNDLFAGLGFSKTFNHAKLRLAAVAAVETSKLERTVAWAPLDEVLTRDELG